MVKRVIELDVIPDASGNGYLGVNLKGDADYREMARLIMGTSPGIYVSGVKTLIDAKTKLKSMLVHEGIPDGDIVLEG